MIAPFPRHVDVPTDVRVLLVDDETAVRKLIKLYLEQNGFSVVDAASGAEALEVLARERQRIRLVITDLMMPGMSGQELAVRLRRCQPDLPIFFVSGYSDQLPEEPYGDCWMQKPLNLPRLVEIVTRLVTHERAERSSICA